MVYDCMDDMISMYCNDIRSRLVAINEKELVGRADVVFCSSKNLQRKMSERYNRDDTILINNAITSSGNSEKSIPALIDDFRQKARSVGDVVLGYAGTIDSWFDFDAVLGSLASHRNIVYLLAGPAKVQIPAHERLFHLGILQHTEVSAFLSIADILVMPFHVSELILGVNPVKVYEYINADKPCIVRRYPETEMFERFVYLYHDIGSYFSSISLIIANGMRNRVPTADCKSFVLENTWDNRAREICDIIRRAEKHIKYKGENEFANKLER
jgi:teichuronic acid biosynthesis glycosyltransferase TuaH